jgi:hypothetical protein
MAKTNTTKSTEPDGVFLLKVVLYVMLGSLWLKLHGSTTSTSFPIPVGLIVGIAFTTHEHFQIDRKIEYAVLVVAALIGLIAPYGLFINL